MPKRAPGFPLYVYNFFVAFTGGTVSFGSAPHLWVARILGFFPSLTVKKFNDFPVTSRDVTNQTLRVTFRLVTGKSITFFYSVLAENQLYRLFLCTCIS
jgi:hypothetical protein